MRWWYSVSARLTLLVLGLTVGSLAGLSLVLDTALKNFFIQDAIASLQRQADVFASRAKFEWNNPVTLRQWTELIAQQGQLQVIVFDSAGRKRIESEEVSQADAVNFPTELIPKIIAGVPLQGRFQVVSDSQYPWWLYSIAPIRQGNESKVVGAVYIAMPMRRPKQFAQQVEQIVIAMTIAVMSVSALAGLLFSRSFTQPLERLHQQAKRLGAGDYTARSHLKGRGELAQLSHLFDDMAAKLTTTLKALKAQETARRELVTNVSHDLRTPLASLRVELEAVLDGVVKGEKAQQYLQRAYRETDYLARLVDQLLWLARADAGQIQVYPQLVSAMAIAQECFSRMEIIASQVEIQLKLEVSPHLPLVWVDPELTGQIVLNLLDNAIKYASDSEVISLEVLPTLEQNQQLYVPLQVRDTGSGIEPEVLQRITERFYRGNEARPRGGLGLGLAIAQEVCQLQGGKLEIESQLTKGTIVRLLLPTKP
jgi:signal transduction histidine kinase